MIHRKFLFGTVRPDPVPIPPPYSYNEVVSLTSTRTSSVYDYYGRCVALSNDGTTLVVGSDETSMNNNVNSTAGPGRVYVYRPGGSWSPAPAPYITLVASDGQLNDSFGKSVAVSSDGTVVVVGAPGAKIGANTRQGAAYVYVWNAPTNTWVQIRKLTADDGTAEDTYGYSVAISADGTTIAIGSNSDDTVSGYRVGSVYLYSAIQLATGTANIDADTLTVTAFSGTGAIGVGSLITGVGIPTDTRIIQFVSGVGGTGVYKVSTSTGGTLTGIAITVSTTWDTETKLVAGDSRPDDNYGCSVALSNDGSTLVVGSSGSDIGVVANSGAIYSYSRAISGSSTVWSTGAKSWANNPVSGASYGYSIALTGDSTGLVVGAPGVGTGAVYLLDRSSGGQWRQRTVLQAADGATGDHYGWSVSTAFTLRWVMVGAPGCSAPIAECGASYIYVNNGTGWVQTAKLVASDAAIGDNCGYSVTMSDDALTVASGAPFRSVDTLSPPSTTYIHGSTYIFTQ